MISPTLEVDKFINPVMATVQTGGLGLAVLSRGLGGSSTDQYVGVTTLEKGKWDGGLATVGGLLVKGKSDERNKWNPAVAAGPEGKWAVAYDEYQQGDYDVFVSEGRTKENLNTPLKVAGSARFEARPSICYDAAGRLWIAYEEGPEQWGKDYGAAR